MATTLSDDFLRRYYGFDIRYVNRLKDYLKDAKPSELAYEALLLSTRYEKATRHCEHACDQSKVEWLTVAEEIKAFVIKYLT